MGPRRETKDRHHELDTAAPGRARIATRMMDPGGQDRMRRSQSNSREVTVSSMRRIRRSRF